ncbi:MAG: DUF2203 domain-containing protein [Deltaproteobacteria bacterium]|nr:DUF2203 domain-containing protein [Deltaproteobacteria bacterium]
MPSYEFDKVFTPAEANELIPRLEVAVRELQASAGELRGRIAELVAADPDARQLPLPEIIERYPQLRKSAGQLARAAEKIESYGCVLKDIDQGLIDFPWEIEEDRVVFLCWQLGEPAVIAWHPIDAGFAQRQPLSGAPKHYLN